MSHWLDQILVAAAILGALGFFARRFFGSQKKGCDSGCGCDVAKKPIVKRP